jgi:hypothetical protein
MSPEGDLSHRQEREKKKEEHAHPTRGKYLSSMHLSWAMAVGVILTGAAVIIWTFLLPALYGPG